MLLVLAYIGILAIIAFGVVAGSGTRLTLGPVVIGWLGWPDADPDALQLASDAL